MRRTAVSQSVRLYHGQVAEHCRHSTDVLCAEPRLLPLEPCLCLHVEHCAERLDSVWCPQWLGCSILYRY